MCSGIKVSTRAPPSESLLCPSTPRLKSRLRSRSRKHENLSLMWTDLDWLIAHPLAHRGLHDEARGVIENTPSAVAAAIAANYGIEVDVQITADGEAMVHHDDVLGRLTDGEGRLDQFTAAELKQVAFRGTADRMMTLGELCDLNSGRTTMLVELKSKFDRDDRLPSRVAEVLSNYRGPVAPMSFDPNQLA